MFREVWKPIPGYEGLYQVSDLGRVKSLNYNHTGKEQILSPGKRGGGYMFVNLCKDGKVKKFLVHRLVWIAFNGPIPVGMVINHKDERPWNNRLDNLMVCTQKANINWGTRNKKVAKALSKMVEQYTLDGIHICTWFNTIGIKKELRYSLGNISECCNGKRRTAYGYIWKYVE